MSSLFYSLYSMMITASVRVSFVQPFATRRSFHRLASTMIPPLVVELDILLHGITAKQCGHHRFNCSNRISWDYDSLETGNTYHHLSNHHFANHPVNSNLIKPFPFSSSPIPGRIRSRCPEPSYSAVGGRSGTFGRTSGFRHG